MDQQTSAGRFRTTMTRYFVLFLALFIGMPSALGQEPAPPAGQERPAPGGQEPVPPAVQERPAPGGQERPALAGQERTPQAPPVTIDVLHYDISAELSPENSALKGETTVRFAVLQDTLSIPFELNNRLSIIEIKDSEGNSFPTSFDGVDSQKLTVRGEGPFKGGTEKTLTFRFDGTLEPQQYAFLDTPRTERVAVYPEGATLLTEGRWFPSYRLPMDTATATVKISVPLGLTVVGPGKMEPTDIQGVSEIFVWKSETPIGKIPVIVSKFFRQPAEGPGVPLTFFVGEEQKDLAPITKEIRQIVDFLSNEYGAYPFESLTVVDAGRIELPSYGSAGLVLLEGEMFKALEPQLLELAKRVALQWWGYSAKPREIYDAWLQDGLATYAALRYFETKYPDRFQTELAKQSINAMKYESRGAVGKGFALQEGTPEYRSVIASKGAWVIHMLGQMIGRDKLNSMLKSWYTEHAGKTVTTPELVKYVAEQSGQDYKWFFMQWVENNGIPDFRVEYKVFKRKDGTFAVRGSIKQDSEMFRMPLEVLIETKGEHETKNLTLTGKNTSFNFQSQTLPVRLRVDPNGKILQNSPQMQVQVLIALGEEYTARGDYVEAIRQFEKGRELDPRSSLAHYRLGEVFFLQHSFTNAANSFRDTLNGDLKPEWVETWTHIFMGKIYDILNQRERATAEYQKAINTKNDYNGAQAEAQKYLKEPFTKPQSIIG